MKIKIFAAFIVVLLLVLTITPLTTGTPIVSKIKTNLKKLQTEQECSICSNVQIDETQIEKHQTIAKKMLPLSPQSFIFGFVLGLALPTVLCVALCAPHLILAGVSIASIVLMFVAGGPIAVMELLMQAGLTYSAAMAGVTCIEGCLAAEVVD